MTNGEQLQNLEENSCFTKTLWQYVTYKWQLQSKNELKLYFKCYCEASTLVQLSPKKRYAILDNNHAITIFVCFAETKR